MSNTTLAAGGSATLLAAKYRRVRSLSEAIVSPLAPEDCVIQSMPDVSPTRWHLAHTSWFFETFFLKPRGAFTAPQITRLPRPSRDAGIYLFDFDRKLFAKTRELGSPAANGQKRSRRRERCPRTNR